MRKFEDTEAVRGKVPLLVAIAGPTGTGKTKSALRLADGIRRVNGGEIFVADTESKRALHHAGVHRFRHIDFRPPHSSLDYLEAARYARSRGASVVIFDSASHEHEGEGGVLEMHDAELTRMAGDDVRKRKSMSVSAWSKPKQDRRRMINGLLQLDCSFIFCFRAKEKIKPVSGGAPVSLGWLPIAGSELLFEMTLKFLLLPSANGIPSWRSKYETEAEVMKLPGQFKPLFGTPGQLSEDIGEKLAIWASGGDAPKATPLDELVNRFDACADHDSLEALEKERGTVWAQLSKGEKVRLKAASDAARERSDRAGRRLREEEAPNDQGGEEDGLTLADNEPDNDEAAEIARQDREAAR